MTTRNRLVTIGETVDSRNEDGTREQYGLAPQPASTVRKKPKTPQEAFGGGAFKKPSCLDEMSAEWGVWYSAQVLDLVRCRRNLGQETIQPVKSWTW